MTCVRLPAALLLSGRAQQSRRSSLTQSRELLGLALLAFDQALQKRAERLDDSLVLPEASNEDGALPVEQLRSIRSAAEGAAAFAGRSALAPKDAHDLPIGRELLRGSQN